MGNHSKRLKGGRCGFTLIEAAMVTVIVGVGFMAMLQLLGAGTRANLQGAATTTGINFAKNIREMSLKLPFSGLAALNNRTYSPPVNSLGAPVAGFDNWTQQVQTQPVDPDQLTLDIADANPVALRVTVTVFQNGEQVCRASWYAFDAAHGVEAELEPE